VTFATDQLTDPRAGHERLLGLLLVSAPVGASRDRMSAQDRDAWLRAWFVWAGFIDCRAARFRAVPSPLCKFCGVGERPVTLDQEVRVGQACPGDDEAGPAEQQLVGAEFDAEQVVPQEACGVVGPVAAVAVVEERRAVPLLV